MARRTRSRRARERVRVARALGRLPRLAQALARGELSYSKLRALTRVATPETEERLLAVGRAGTAEHVERIVRGLAPRGSDRRSAGDDEAVTAVGLFTCFKTKTGWWSSRNAGAGGRGRPD